MVGSIDTDTSNIALSSRLIQQESLNNILGSSTASTTSESAVDSNFLIDSSDISSQAMQMFQKEQDIMNFTQLAMSDMDDLSHNEMVEQLFSEGITDVFEESAIAALSSNSSLLDDLGL